MWHWISTNRFSNKRITHHFFASYHGHSLADSHAASIKRIIRTEYNMSQLQRFDTSTLAIYWVIIIMCVPASHLSLSVCRCAVSSPCALFPSLQPPLLLLLLLLLHQLLPHPLFSASQSWTLCTLQANCMASREMRLGSVRSAERRLLPLSPLCIYQTMRLHQRSRSFASLV